jgi:hypothetical protein
MHELGTTNEEDTILNPVNKDNLQPYDRLFAVIGFDLTWVSHQSSCA